jgi:hypothetical protein
METNTLWKKAIRHILGGRKPDNDNLGCSVIGLHEGPTVTVASGGDDGIRLCLHHAKAWSDSDLCRDYARTGHDAGRVLSTWIASENHSASA